MITKVLQRKEFQEKPPVLVDVGASGELFPPWAPLAPYAVAVAFDPDRREMGHAASGRSPFRTLHIRNTIVVGGEETECDFYLTRSPYCSSTLPPEKEKLQHFTFAPRFDVEKKTRLKAENLPHALADLGLTHVDWLKVDSQGTDLRIFQSLPEGARRNVLSVDLEPGFIDAYEGEDKAWAVLRAMEHEPFFLSHMRVMPAKRVSQKMLASLSEGERVAVERASADTPAWTELSYLRTLASSEALTIREYLLLFVLATLKGQYGFALEVAREGHTKFHDEIFSELETHTKATTLRHYQKDRLKSRGARIARKLLRIVRR